MFLPLVGGLLVLGLVAGAVGRAAGLWWYPWEIRQRTAMIRTSNSYVTTQQAALRQLRTAYEDAASPGQRNAIAAQMHGIADLVPTDVPGDIEAFLSTH